jgi:hypothetical protein
MDTYRFLLGALAKDPFWPKPVGQASKAGCQIENLPVAAKGAEPLQSDFGLARAVYISNPTPRLSIRMLAPMKFYKPQG